MRRVLISRITAHGLDATLRLVFPVLLTFLWLVVLAVSTVQGQELDFTVEVNQAGARFTIQANNATTLHWVGGEGSRSTESSDVLTVASGSSWDDPPDDKPHKPYGIWPSFNTLIESVSWLPLYAQEMVVGYRLWLSLQEDSLSIKGFSWWPVVATVVLGELNHTWWHSEGPSFNQWEEQQRHRASDLKIITCMDHPPGQSVHPQGGGGSGVSNQWGGYNGRGNSFCVHDGYDPSGGGGGGHYPHDGHTHNYRPCPACYQQSCQYQYPIESNPHYYGHYYGQPGFLMNGAVTLSHYPPEPSVPTSYGVGDLFGYQGGHVISSETGRVSTQQESPVHEPGVFVMGVLPHLSPPPFLCRHPFPPPLPLAGHRIMIQMIQVVFVDAALIF